MEVLINQEAQKILGQQTQQPKSYITFTNTIFSLPEPKAQMSFSDQNLSVVRRCRCFH